MDYLHLRHQDHSLGALDRTVDGEALLGRVNDKQCTSCHASKRENVAQHTKHPAGSKGKAILDDLRYLLKISLIG